MFNRFFLNSLQLRSRNKTFVNRRERLCSESLRRNSSKDANSIFITTPIFYVNAAPHLGHAYTAVLADSLARWFRIKGKNVLFSTGTDEHGLKIQQAAEKKGMNCEEHCQFHSEQFRSLFDKLNISYDNYIRTTEARHKKSVLHFWNILHSKGFLSEGVYSGWYSTSDEEFLTEEETEIFQDPITKVEKRISKLTGKDVEWVEERNIKFPLGNFKHELIHWLRNNNDVILPIERAKEIEKEVDEMPEMLTLSVSRKSERVKWGINCPTHSDQTVYVWLDALVNYLTVTGFPEDDHWRYHWPPDYHIIGKDITRFHSIYWPSFLLGAGIELPRKIIAHAHWTVNKKKMSKSLGNVIHPLDLIVGHSSETATELSEFQINDDQKVTVDEFRFFILREGGLVNDGDFSLEQLGNRVRNDLAHQFGNLIARCLSRSLNPKGVYPSYELFATQPLSDDEIAIVNSLKTILQNVTSHYERLDFQNGIGEILALIRSVNLYFTETKPWVLVKDQNNSATVNKILYIILESIRITAILLQPILPSTMEKLLDYLQIPTNERASRYAVLGASNQSLCNMTLNPEKLILFPSHVKK